MTTSYEAIEVPAEPKPIDAVGDEIKAEPPAPPLPPAGTYGASDTRAKKLGLYAVALRKWGRGLITAVAAREKADAAIVARQNAERAAALARLEALKAAENE